MSFFSKIRNAKDKLTRIGTKEPLNFLSIVILIALDFFVLWNVFQGLGFQTQQLTSPREAIPYACLNFTENKYFKSDADVVEDVLGNSRGYYRSTHLSGKFASAQGMVDNANKEKLFVPCRKIYDVAEKVNKNQALQNIHANISGLKRNIRDLSRNHSNFRNSYDTLLLERIANQSDKNSITESNADKIKSDLATLKNNISFKNNEILVLKNKLLEDVEVKNLLRVIGENKSEIKKQNEYLKYWYPLKKFIFQLVFLLPLLVLFFVLYKYAVKKEKNILVLIFAHLLVVVSIPIVLEVFRLLLEILPFHFLGDLLEILEALGLVTLWNYALILLGILGALGLIYLVQTKLFSQKRLHLKRIFKKQCCHCGTRLEDDMNICYKCGEKHLIDCTECQHKTFVSGSFCLHCGCEDFKSNK